MKVQSGIKVALAAMVWAGCVASFLVGCGGSPLVSSGGTTGGTSSEALIEGQVLAPESQVSGLMGRGEGLVAVSQASVVITDLDSGNVVGETETDDNGNYTFSGNFSEGNYEVEATKSTNGGELVVSGVFTHDGSTGSKKRDLDPDSTVAGEAAKEQRRQLEAAESGEGKKLKLEDLAREMEARRRADGALPPDLTDPEKIREERDGDLNEKKASGSFYGTAEGDLQVQIAMLVHEGKFMMFALPEGDQPGGEAGRDGGNERPEPREHVIVGEVAGNGVVVGHMKNGVKVKGLLIGNVGIGVWQDGDKSGTWRVDLLVGQYSGMYAGKFRNPEGDGFIRESKVMTLVLDDNRLFVEGHWMRGDVPFWFGGVGTMNGDGTFSFAYTDAEGNIGTGSGQSTGEIIEGGFASTNNAVLEWRGMKRFELFD